MESILDWGLIGQEYVYGQVVINSKTGNKSVVFPSYKDLALKYDVAERTVANNSKVGNWVLKRNSYLGKYKAQLKHDHLRELFIARNENAGQTLQQLDHIGKLIDFYLGQYVDILHHDTGVNQIDFRDFYNDPERPIQIDIKELKTLVDMIGKQQELRESILQVDADLYEQMENVKAGEETVSPEVSNMLSILGKRTSQKKEYDAKVKAKQAVADFDPSKKNVI